jgi:hypothetical protein
MGGRRMISQELNMSLCRQGDNQNCEMKDNAIVSALFFVTRAMIFKNSQHLKEVLVLDNNLNLNGGKNKWMNKSH